MDVKAYTLADAIVRFRGKYNLTQQEFAEMCKLTKQTVGAIEAGRTSGTRLTRAKIIQLLESDGMEVADG